MALNSSGPISLGGATTGQSINLELGQTATTQVSLNDTNVRALAGVTTSFSTIVVPLDFWGKSSTSYWIAAIPGCSNVSIQPFGSITVANNGTDYIMSVTCRNSADSNLLFKARVFKIDGNNASILNQIEIASGNRAYYVKQHTDNNVYCAMDKFTESARARALIVKLDSSLNYVATSQASSRSGSTASREFSCFDFDTSNVLYAPSETYGVIRYDTNLNQLSVISVTGSSGYLKFKNSTQFVNQLTTSYIQAIYDLSTSTTIVNNSTTNSGNQSQGQRPTFNVPYNFMIKVGHGGTANGSLPCVIKLDGSTFAPIFGITVLGVTAGFRTYSTSTDSSGNIYTFGIRNNSSLASDLLTLFKFNSSGTLLWQREITSTLGAQFKAIDIDASKSDSIVIAFSVGPGSYVAYPIMMKLPVDGSKTGTYSINGGTVTYQTSSYSFSTFTVPNTTQTVTLFGITNIATSNTGTVTSFTSSSTTI